MENIGELRKNENGRHCFNRVLINKWEIYFKGLLTKK
jgi:hypothetical protein